MSGFSSERMEESPVRTSVMVKTSKEALFFVLGRQPGKESYIKLEKRKYLHLHLLKG